MLYRKLNMIGLFRFRSDIMRMSVRILAFMMMVRMVLLLRF